MYSSVYRDSPRLRGVFSEVLSGTLPLRLSQPDTGFHFVQHFFVKQRMQKEEGVGY